VILGTVAVRDPALVRKAAGDFPEQIAVAVDVKHGKVAVHGWVDASELEPIELAKRFEDSGVAALIVTDIGRDGALTGINIEGVGSVADAVSIPVIASGGLASVKDIELLKARKACNRRRDPRPRPLHRRNHPGRGDPRRPAKDTRLMLKVRVIPAWTSRTAAWSRASTSWPCATPAIRWSRPRPMTPPAPTN